MVDLIAGAIADPVRRQILDLLRAGPLPAGVIADHFAITRPAISRHLRVLRESGLVRDETVGRQRVYALDAQPLDELVDWVTRLRASAAAWDQRLNALETEVHRTRRERRADDETHPGRRTGSDG